MTQNNLTLWKASTPFAGHLSKYTTTSKRESGAEVFGVMSLKSAKHASIASVSGLTGAALVNLAGEVFKTTDEWLWNEMDKARVAGRIQLRRMNLAASGRGGTVKFVTTEATRVADASKEQIQERAGQLGFALVPIEGAVQSNGKAPEQQPLIDAESGKVEAPKGKGNGKSKASK